MRTKVLFGLLIIFSLCSLCSFAQEQPTYKSSEIIYGRKDGMALTMVMLQPEKQNGKGIISVASGSWISSYNLVPNFTRRAENYLKSGYTVFIVMHGSQPRYTVPEAATDVKRAVRFVRYHANDYKIDPDKIGITGSSAGGNLSLLVAMNDDKIDTTFKDPVNHVSSRVQAVAVFYPPTDFLNWGAENVNPISNFRPLLSKQRVLSAFEYKEWNDSLSAFRVITDPGKILAISKSISPAQAASADDPPILVIHGDKDMTVPLQQSELLMTRLKAVNVVSQLLIKIGGMHGWENISEDEKKFVEWFDKYLK